MQFYDEPLYEKLIHFDEVKNLQVKLTVNTFRGVEYLALRKYYQDFATEDWMPSKEGVTMALDFDNSRNLFIALTEILSLAESKEVIEGAFGDLLKGIYIK
jgi:hypothetical protein